jgi:hypothetical protein
MLSTVSMNEDLPAPQSPKMPIASGACVSLSAASRASATASARDSKASLSWLGRSANGLV